MQLLTSTQMQRVDAETIERVCPGIELMERAGHAVASIIADRFADLSEASPKAVIFCGNGNNGGDGLVIARYLSEWGWRCSVHLAKPGGDLSVDAGRNHQRLAQMLDDYSSLKILEVSYPEWPRLSQEDVGDADVFVDCILGTGVTGPPSGNAALMIEAINNGDTPVVSVDIPSGVNGDNGDIAGDAVVADLTVAIGAAKVGLMFHPGRSVAGEVTVVDIGFPAEIIDQHGSKVFVLDEDTARFGLPDRRPDAHKYDAGALLVIAGSRRYGGAALLTARAAQRSGCGMVYLAVPASMRDAVDLLVPEVITVALPETAEGTIAEDGMNALQEYLDRVDAIALGPGLSRHDNTDAFVRTLYHATRHPLVLDADAITAFAGDAGRMKGRGGPVVVTPHSGELHRLLGVVAPTDPVERIAATQQWAQELGVVLVHKGAPVIIAAPEGHAWVNAAGTAALATGGTGDVLTGLIGGLLASGAEPDAAAAVGAFAHGRAGEIVAGTHGERGTTAGDVAMAVGAALRELDFWH